jgi:hypothetical protein
LDVHPGHLQRILAELEGKDLFEALAEHLSPTDLQSLLLEVANRRAAKVTPAVVANRSQEDRFCQHSKVDARRMIELDRTAFDVAASRGFQPIELSPVCPLGTVSALAKVSQNNIVSTIRNTEVVSDSTNVMAIECAARRKTQEVVRLCASHRLLRAQPFSGPASFAHFRVFSMCSAGRNMGNRDFERDALIDQIGIYLQTLEELTKLGYSHGKPRVGLTDFSEQNGEVLNAVQSKLQDQFPKATIEVTSDRIQAKGYYYPFCFWIFVTGEDGVEQNIGDGGFTDWTQQLLSNKKERLLISGVGSERMCFLFCPPEP